MTTLELTAISSAVVMMATSFGWYFKSSITQATYLDTKEGLTMEKIRGIRSRPCKFSFLVSNTKCRVISTSLTPFNFRHIRCSPHTYYRTG